MPRRFSGLLCASKIRLQLKLSFGRKNCLGRSSPPPKFGLGRLFAGITVGRRKDGVEGQPDSSLRYAPFRMTCGVGCAALRITMA